MSLLGLESKLLISVACIYGLSFIFYLLYLIVPRAIKQGSIASWILRIGILVHIVLIITRTIQTKHPPFQTLYEALSWFGFTVIAAYIIIEWRRKNRLPGAFVTAITIAALMYAIFGLSSTPRPLMPALQSKWFVIPVLFFHFYLAPLLFDIFSTVDFFFTENMGMASNHFFRV